MRQLAVCQNHSPNRRPQPSQEAMSNTIELTNSKNQRGLSRGKSNQTIEQINQHEHGNHRSSSVGGLRRLIVLKSADFIGTTFGKGVLSFFITNFVLRSFVLSQHKQNCSIFLEDHLLLSEMRRRSKSVSLD